MADNPPPASAAPRPARSPAAANVVPVSPALQRPAQPRPRPPQPHANSHLTTMPPSYTRTGTGDAPAMPAPSHNAASSGANNAHGRPPAPQQRSNTGKESLHHPSSGNNPPQRHQQPLQSPQPLSSLPSPLLQRPPTHNPQQSIIIVNPSPKPQSTHQPLLNTGADALPGSGQPRHSPGIVPIKGSSPMVSPSTPLSALPQSQSGASPVSSSAPKGRTPVPPTLPPARAHGIHARALPKSTAQSALPPNNTFSGRPKEESPTKPTIGSVISNHQVPQSPGPREFIYPPSTLQAPQQAHQPRQRQSVSHRPPVDAVPRPQPPKNARQPSSLSLPIVLPSNLSDTSSQMPVATHDSTAKASGPVVTGVSKDDDLQEQGDSDDVEEENESTKGTGNEKFRRSRHRKVRRSLEKLTRISTERKRRSRQLKAMSTVSPPKSPMAGHLATKPDPPKRQSLWASIFGNGRAESRPSVADSLVKSNGSTQSLGSTSVDRQEQDSQQQSYSSTMSSPTSPRSDKSFSDSVASAPASVPDSESVETEPLEGQVVQEDSAENAEAGKTSPTVEDISAVNVAPHDRSRTLPGIWDSNILWSLSRVLSTKKVDPPLEIESSDSDSSEETQAEDSHNAEETPADIPQKEPSVPLRAALSVRTNIPKERVIVAESQVQIGDALDDEDPFTDSHAWPTASPSAAGTWGSSKGLSSGSGSSNTSSPSPSLSPLSYITGTSPSGSWSLQGSRQSLMKMIFKSKNDASSPSSSSTPGTPHLTSGSNTSAEQTNFSHETRQDMQDPSTPLHTPHPDLFSGFESTGQQEDSLVPLSKELKRRSFIIPGAFPGQEPSSVDDTLETESEATVDHIPMYAAAVCDSLAAHDPTADEDQDPDVSLGDYYDQDGEDEASPDLEPISTVPTKASSYDRPSFLAEPPLPRFNPAAPSVPGRHVRTVSQPLTGPIAQEDTSSSKKLGETEMLQIEVHRVTTSVTMRQSSGISNSKTTAEARSRQGKTSPSALAVAIAPPSKIDARTSVISPITPPFKVSTTTNFAMNDTPMSKSHGKGNSNSSEAWSASVNNTIDYSRYKEEVYDSDNARPDPFRNTSSRPVAVSKVSGYQSGDSRAGTSLRNQREDSTSPVQSSTAHSQGASSITENDLQHQQSKLKTAPPPLPPPRNSRRPRSKTLSRYSFNESTGQTVERAYSTGSARPTGEHEVMHSRSSNASPFHTSPFHVAPLSTAMTLPNNIAYESPAKEYIMEEMGSEQARTFNEEDYIYYQNDKARNSVHGGSSHGLRSQSSSGSLGRGHIGQAYGPGNSAFDPLPEWNDYAQQQQQILQQQQQRSQPNSGEIMASSQWQHVAHSAATSSNEASLVAALRDQIASLSSERDQFYQEAMLLRQKHETLTNIVNTMGVAVESIQAQQQQQQQVQQQQQQQMQITQQMQHQGHIEYGSQVSSQEPPHIQPRRHHEDYSNNRYHEQASNELQMNGIDGSDSTAAYQREQFELQQQQQPQLLEEPQIQPRRNHFHDHDHQSARVRQLSDEFSIQMPRNSEESLRSFGGGGGGGQEHYQDPSLAMTSMQPVYPGPMGGATDNMGDTSFVGDTPFHRDISFQGDSSFHGVYDAPHSMDLQNLQQQQPQQMAQMQHQPLPLSFEEGYDLIVTESEPVEPMNEIGGYYQQSQQQQLEEEQMRGGGLTLQELKLLHGQSGSGYATQRGSSDSRFSGSQGSQDAYQLIDVVTTRPMSGSSLRQQLEPRNDLGYGQDASGYGSFQSQAPGIGPVSMLKDQHLEQLRTRSSFENLGTGLNTLRRHHSMHQPLVPQQFQVQPPFQPQQQQQSHQPYPIVPQLPPSMGPPPQRLHQPRPPPWAPQHLKRSSSSSLMMHRRMPSNPQDIPSLPSQGLLLLSSSTSFMGESPMLSSLALESSVGAGSMAPLSLLSNVVQREKVRIEGKTSSTYGAAGWSERPFSPVIANASNDEVEAHVPSFASVMMNNDSSSSTTGNSHLPPPVPPSRSVTKDEANKIRQQFDSYLADPKRRSRHLEMKAEEDRRLKEREQERERERDRVAQEDAARLQSLIQKQESVEITDVDSDTSVDSDEEEYSGNRNRSNSGAAYTSMATSAPDSSSGWDQYQQLLLKVDKSLKETSDKREKEEVVVEAEQEEAVPSTTSESTTSNRVDSVGPEFEIGAIPETINVSTGLLGRSKTIASTGISSRAAKENSFRAQPPPPPASNQPSAQQQQSISSSLMKSNNPFLNAANISSSTPQQQPQKPFKETLLRQQSSSGSLRSVARHSEQHRGATTATATTTVADEQSAATRPGTKATGVSSGTAGMTSGPNHASPAPALPKAAAVPLVNPRPAPTPSASTATAVATNGQRTTLPLPPATLPRPPASTFKPSAAPPIPPAQDRSPAATLVSQTPHYSSSSSQSTSTPVFSSVLASSSTSKTVVDEEGGDWGLQANPPRRYHSVKLGMGSMTGGVTGATRRVIGRPVERGHGIERGPEDCV